MNMPKTYTDNRYYKNNPIYFKQLRKLILQYPRQCTHILLAKGRKREGANNWKFKYLYDWIMQMSCLFVETPPTLIEILLWIMNDMIDYPICENQNCKNKIRKLQIGGRYAKHCCCKCSGKNPQTLKQRELTCLKIYGSKNIFSSDYGKNKIRETCLKNYGVPYSGMSSIKKKHTEESNIKKYGVKNVNQVPEIKERGTTTLMKNYGQLFNYSKYKYDNHKFDSSWEIIYYMYLKDHKIQFEFHKTNFFFTYKKEGKLKRYYPDFIVENEIHEIKGDQFFNDKNEPYDTVHKLWWKEKYQCMIDHNVKILRSADLKPVFEWFYSIYDNNYLQKFLTSKACQKRYYNK